MKYDFNSRRKYYDVGKVTMPNSRTVLRRHVKASTLVKLAHEDFGKNFTVSTISISDRIILMSGGYLNVDLDASKIAELEDLVRWLQVTHKVEVFDEIKSRLTRRQLVDLATNNLNVFVEFMDDIELNSNDWVLYFSNIESRYITKRVARRCLGDLPKFASKVNTRRIVESAFRYMTNDDVKAIRMTAKETISLLANIMAFKRKTGIVVDDDLLVWLEKKLFIETIKCKSCTSKVLTKNMEFLKSIKVQKS